MQKYKKYLLLYNAEYLIIMINNLHFYEGISNTIQQFS